MNIRKPKQKILLFFLSISCLYFFYLSFDSVRFQSYEELMGGRALLKRNIKHPIDEEDLNFYKSLYEKNKDLINNSSYKKERIPKIIHFIWIGPHNFPETSKQNILSWIKLHPDWQVLFWTDRERDTPYPEMEKKNLADFPLLSLYDQYNSSVNVGEQSDLLRLEILRSFGGVYVDHDAECMHSFDDLHANFDFYAGLEKPHSILGIKSAIFPCIGVIGSVPHHPILEETISRIRENWSLKPADHVKSTDDLVIQRTFKNFGESVRSLIGQSSYRDMILPASYFFSEDLFDKKKIRKLLKKEKVYVKHYWANAWITDLNLIDLQVKNQMLEKKIKELRKKYHQKKVILYTLSSLLVVCLVLILRKRKNDKRMLS